MPDALIGRFDYSAIQIQCEWQHRSRDWPKVFDVSHENEPTESRTSSNSEKLFRWLREREDKWAWLAAIRYSLSFAFRRKAILDELITSNSVLGVSPHVFFFICTATSFLMIGIAPILNPARVGWCEPAAELIPTQREGVFSCLGLKDIVDAGGIKDVTDFEKRFPGGHEASSRVRFLLKNDDADSVFRHLLGCDTAIALAYQRQIRISESVRKWLSYGGFLIAIITSYASALPLIGLFRTRTAKQTVAVYLVYSAVWGMFGVFMAILFQFVMVLPVDRIGIIIGQALVMLAMSVDFVEVFHYSHGVSRVRAITGYVLSLAAMGLSVGIIGLSVDPLLRLIASNLVK